MNKTELVEQLAAKTGLAKSDVSKSLDAFLETVVETVTNGDKVQIVGFGTFEQAQRSARTGRNPSTGAVIQIAASKAPRFAPGKSFKDRVAGK